MSDDAAGRPRGRTARSKARKRALDVLFAAELRSEAPLDALERVLLAPADSGERPGNPYTAELVRGVAAHQARIDEVLSDFAEGWTLERMPAVDRNVLRLAVYELIWAEDVPDEVVVSEAVGLVHELSTDDSPGFVNGILGSIARSKPTPEA